VKSLDHCPTNNLPVQSLAAESDISGTSAYRSWAFLTVHVFTIVYRYETGSEQLYSRHTWNLSSGRHLYSGYTLRVFLYSWQELQVWMQSRIHRWWRWLHRWAKGRESVTHGRTCRSLYINYCKKLSSLQRLLRTTSANSQI